MKRFEVGSRVHEPTYGLGSVIAVEDAFTRIQFDDKTVRKFLTSLAKIEPSSEPAPPTRARKRKTATASKTTKKAAKKTTKKAAKKTTKAAAKKTTKSAAKSATKSAPKKSAK
ncbi:MAG: hypothetical protein QF681_15835 [Vicinamibacterales bacterium]|jgi:hypothetical protein|nr:hypothetical protein [Vicinamibacterales bacterium]